MPFEMPEQGQRLVKGQHDVISRAQGKQSGLSGNAMDGRLRTGHWQRVHRGVYAVVTGHIGREAQLRAALLRAGEGAVLSHYTAAELHGLTDQPGESIHITVPQRRCPARHKKIPGVVIHRSDLILRTEQPARTLPVTRVAETVIDLINDAMTFEAAYQWICRAIGRGEDHGRPDPGRAGQPGQGQVAHGNQGRPG
jgi:predicted transcriptional regulator of viral defense system